MEEIENIWVERKSYLWQIFLFALGIMIGVIASMDKLEFPYPLTGAGIVFYFSIILIGVCCLLWIFLYFDKKGKISTALKTTFTKKK